MRLANPAGADFMQERREIGCRDGHHRYSTD
jgi:hypothetical protein